MQERKPGCICQLDDTTGEPLVADYAECQVHKPDAPDPKSTANKIFESHYGLYSYEVMEPLEQKLSYARAKESAKIEVDDVLNVLDTFQRHEYGKILIPFYQEVKKQIELL